MEERCKQELEELGDVPAMERERDERFAREDEQISIQCEDMDEYYRQMKDQEAALKAEMSAIVQRFEAVEVALAAGRATFDTRQKQVWYYCR